MQCEFKGGNFPVAVCYLGAGQALNCESGAMAWMSDGIKMETNTGGGIGKLFGRAFTGESLFMNRYVAERGGIIAIGAHAPGEIRKITLSPEHPIVVQKGSFLAKDESIDLSIFFQKKIGTGLFGGEGFIMNKLSGTGDVLLEIDGGVVEYTLNAGERLTIDTGYLVMMDATCSIDVQMIKGVGNILFGGEGLFNTVVSGPGKIMIQTQPMVQFVSKIATMIAARTQK
ncbi:TIGR00266 family protein [Butyrivibrio sp. NC3005]|uniref:TIGR00266 family protein n=1 Tax=Butyrivibrio sp. NC3005 TaxID=1280685 RepID=UPI00041197C4|nr:TIGR00266 family protein [Butyrivibrio sp. NC3005]